MAKREEVMEKLSAWGCDGGRAAELAHVSGTGSGFLTVDGEATHEKRTLGEARPPVDLAGLRSCDSYRRNC